MSLWECHTRGDNEEKWEIREKNKRGRMYWSGKKGSVGQAKRKNCSSAVNNWGKDSRYLFYPHPSIHNWYRNFFFSGIFKKQPFFFFKFINPQLFCAHSKSNCLSVFMNAFHKLVDIKIFKHSYYFSLFIIEIYSLIIYTHRIKGHFIFFRIGGENLLLKFIQSTLMKYNSKL